MTGIRKLRAEVGHIIDGRQVDVRSARRDLVGCRILVEGLNPSSTSYSIR